MAETHADIALNDEPVSLSHEELVEEDLNGIIKRLEHLDVNVHEIQQQAERIEKHLEAVTAALADARPLIEKWQHSTIARLARGQMPWQNATGGNRDHPY